MPRISIKEPFVIDLRDETSKDCGFRLLTPFLHLSIESADRDTALFKKTIEGRSWPMGRQTVCLWISRIPHTSTTPSQPITPVGAAEGYELSLDGMSDLFNTLYIFIQQPANRPR